MSRRSGAIPQAVRPGPRVPGPSLAELRRALADAPVDLLAPQTDVPALVADLAVELGGAPLPADWLRHLDTLVGAPAPADRRAVVALGRQLARTAGVRDALRAAAEDAAPWAVLVLTQLAGELEGLRPAAAWRTDGAEELTRAFLAIGGLQPAGESAAVSADAWATASTRYQRVVARDVALERARAEELARALAEKRAREAAAQYANY
ncbi:hypothetical protein [Miniimonas sp. S16]|uniref:hypothetical protein n=1 Tax=Miniimonas sp. S16 TaxID=2171623 RepID=UPI00131EF92A|nr:hypothetical protein [Miniimonas sp. S16]